MNNVQEKAFYYLFQAKASRPIPEHNIQQGDIIEGFLYVLYNSISKRYQYYLIPPDEQRFIKIPIMKDTLKQYTGFTDKNDPSKKIYTTDYVKISNANDLYIIGQIQLHNTALILKVYSTNLMFAPSKIILWDLLNKGFIFFEKLTAEDILSLEEKQSMTTSFLKKEEEE